MANKDKNSQIKRLNPKGAETKYVGFEPEWNFQPTAENRLSRLAQAFNWYNYHYGKKDAKVTNSINIEKTKNRRNTIHHSKHLMAQQSSSPRAR